MTTAWYPLPNAFCVQSIARFHAEAQARASVLLLPMTEVPLLDGAMFRPADADGQLLVVYWWASWCPLCAQQTPLMEKLWRAHRTKGLRLLGLSVDRKTEDARDCMARRGYTSSGLLTPVVARVQPKSPRACP